jgi:chromate reductase
MAKKIAVLIGSLRKASYTRKIVNEMIKQAPASLDMHIIDISSLPIYNEELDLDNVPPTWVTFRNTMKDMDGVIFATPEYNRSVPAVLKNAIDVGSRPYGHSIWSKKPGAIISVSPGTMGGFGANHHLRQSMVFLDVPLLQQPEVYLSNVSQLLNEDGSMKTPSTSEFLKKFIDTYAAWVEKNSH